ncbi:hypothetical protein [Weissella confusa]|uniref:hypothetical protein n=1 Tax=Weissella confusa TaxID=1583 RepID=UPI001FD8780C|nr:hypothetical protein [Weissella confusa]
MFGAFGKSFFRATPQQLFVQLIIDTVWFLIFRPTDPTMKWIFIAILPAVDLLSAVVSFLELRQGQSTTKLKRANVSCGTFARFCLPIKQMF